MGQSAGDDAKPEILIILQKVFKKQLDDTKLLSGCQLHFNYYIVVGSAYNANLFFISSCFVHVTLGTTDNVNDRKP